MRNYRNTIVLVCTAGLGALFLLWHFATPMLAWTVAQPITSGALDSINPAAVVDSHGNIHVAWLQNTTGEETEDVYYRVGDGTNWQTPQNISKTSTRSFNVQLAIMPNDQLVAVWTELQIFLGIPLGSRIYYATYNLQQTAATWSSPIPLSSESLSVGVPFLATYNGEVHAVWGAGSLITGYADRIYHAVWNGTAWTTPQTLPFQSGFLDIADIAFDTAGQLHLVWNGNRTNQGNVHDAYEIYYTTLINGTWQTPINISNTNLYSFYPSLAIDRAGRVHVIWLEEDTGDFGQGAHIFDRILYNRLENGQWLGTPQQLSDISGVFFPNAVADTDGNVHFVWANDTKADLTTILFRLHYVRWDGNTLSERIQIVDGALEDTGQSMAVLALPTSGWLDPERQYLVWAGGDSQDVSQVFFSEQLPHQVSLANLVPPNDMADHPALAGRSATDLHAVWMQGTAMKHTYYSHWDGIRWTNPVVISQQNFDSTSPEIALGADGVPHVVWHAHDSLSNDRTYYTRLQGSTWLTPVLLSDEFDAAGVPDIAVDGAGEVHVVWEMRSEENNYNSAIYYRRTTGGYDQWQSMERVSALGRQANRPRLALDSTATPHIVWYDQDSEEIYYSNRTDGTWNISENVSNSPPATTAINIASHAPGIAIDGSDRLHIAWKDTVSGTQLDTIYYATHNGNGWQRTTIVSQPTTGHDMDQVLGVNVDVLAQPNGDVHLLWSDSTLGSVQVFNSNNLARATGAAWSSPTIVTPHTPHGHRPVGYLDANQHLHLLWVNPIGINQVFYGLLDRFDWIKIVDEAGRPVPNATVYQNSLPVGESDSRGLLFLDNLQAGDELVVLAPVAEYTGWRAGHTSPDSSGKDWAYRIYLTNWRYGADGERIGNTAHSSGAEQQLTVRSTSPLILFNLLVSLEWAADRAYLEDFKLALKKASDYLFDASNGQMAIGRATIYSGGQFWKDADIQVRAFNDNRPNAGINGLRDPLLNAIRVGRSWSGEQGDFGGNLWTEEAGYRTLIHELGHYALGVYDSYFRIERENGIQVGLKTTYCTSDNIKTNGQDPINATLMDYQYTASEFADQQSESWSEECTQTQQYVENNGESDWETIRRLFEERSDSKLRLLSPYDDSQWQLQTPRTTGVLPGPTIVPIQQIPLIQTVAPLTTTLTPLVVHGPQQAIQLASVTLYIRKEGYTDAIDQGYTDRLGKIVLLGARNGDQVNVLSRDTTYAGKITINAGVTNTLILNSTIPQVSASQLAEQALHYVRLLPGAQNRNINVQLVGLGAGASINADLTLTGRNIGTITALAHSNLTNEYRGSLTPNLPDSATTLGGLGQIRISGDDVNGQPVYLAGSIASATLLYGKAQTIAAPDGALRIFVPSAGLPQTNGPIYLLVGEHSVFGPTAHLQSLSPVYQLRLSGSIASFNAPIVLAISPSLHFTQTDNMQIYRFDESEQQWRALPTTWDSANYVASTSQQTTGYFALFSTQSNQIPTMTPTPTLSAPPSATPSATPSVTPSLTPSVTTTETPSITPTLTPTPSTTPTATSVPCPPEGGTDLNCLQPHQIFLPVVLR